MMPFEQDDMELIEACAMALQPVEPTVLTASGAAQAGSAVQSRGRGSPIRTEAASVPAAPALTEPEQLYEFWDLPVSPGAAADVEALSRAVERDARRFEA